MPKSLVLGNGNILIGLDRNGQVRDFYFPYVGLENQAGSAFIHRIGVFVDEKLTWFDDPSWNIYVNYQEETLVSDIQAINTSLNLRIDFTDAVYNEKNIFLRRAVVQNMGNQKRTIKLFFHQEFELYESHRGDTAYYDPLHNVIIHYKGRRVILINARIDDKTLTPQTQVFGDFSVGLFKVEGKEGSYRDAEDGILSKNTIEHGLVDSVIGLELEMEPNSTKTVHYWLTAANSIREAIELNYYVLEKGATYLIGTTRDYWHAWVNKHKFQFHYLDENTVREFKKSLLIMRTHVDNRGAVLASGDSDILYHGRDTYSYMWPRDAALIGRALDKAGDSYVVKKFFEFCNAVVTDEGYFMHRYRADQSLGSSWHSMLHDGEAILPIQVDETALIIYALWNHYDLSKDLEFIESIYNSLIKKCAEFLVIHRESTTGLPKASFDLWEEKFGIHTFTSASVYGALISAAKFASLLGKNDAEARYIKAAKEIQTAILRHLYDAEAGFFYKMINIKNGQTEIDKTIDASSAYGIFKFRILSINDERLIKAFALTEEKLTVDSEVKGIARYEWDKYFTQDLSKVGNPWFITTLWLAQYKIASIKGNSDLEEIKKVLNWAVKYSLPSGIMSEQLNPHTGEPVSATPLIWSHAEFVMTVIKYLEKIDELGL